MKKLFLFFCLLLVSIVTFAQSPSFGIRGGLNFAKFDLSSPGVKSLNTGSKISFSFGAFTDLKFGDFSLQPALNFTGRAGKITRNNATGSSILYYVQVPLNLVYHVHLKPGSIYFGAGPYVAFGTSATDYFDDAEGNTNSQSASFGGTTGEYSSTDAGLNAIAGIQFKSGFLIHLNYDLGLSNILNTNNPDDVNGVMLKTRTLGVSIGVVF
jgi:hypothetical protein